MTENDKNIARQIEEALRSFDNIQRASPKPFLLTRIHAQLNNKAKNIWEQAAFFISRPTVMLFGLSLIIVINLSVIFINNSSKNKVNEYSITSISEEDEYTIPFVTIENNETP